MDIILYDKIVTLPELHSFQAVRNFVTPAEIEQEKARELRSFLEALSHVKLPIIAHISVERNDNGEKIEAIFTSKQKDVQGLYIVIWGTGINSFSGNGDYMESFKLDFDTSKIKGANSKDFFIKQKNTKEWLEHFVFLFSRIRYEQKKIIAEAVRIVNCLND